MARTKRKDSGSATSRFTPETLEAVAKDLKTGRLPLDRTQISDDIVTGLRAMVNRSGLISLHASYYVGGERPFIRLGALNKDEPDHITIDEARHLTKVIKALGDKGIDVQAGLHQRLIRELLSEGTDWRPEPAKRKKAAA